MLRSRTSLPQAGKAIVHFLHPPIVLAVSSPVRSSMFSP
jgi:hypothetical protein